MPFVSTLTPSARAKAIGAPVEVDIGDLEVGERKIVKWRGKPVWILRRDDAAIDGLSELDEDVKDPMSEAQQQPFYARNEYRSQRPEYLIVLGLCTHLGCSPNYIRKTETHPIFDDWPGPGSLLLSMPLQQL